MLSIPATLDWWGETTEGAAWLVRLPAIVEHLAARWQLQLEAPFAGSNVSLAVPASLHDGTRAVLKITFPGEETEHDADALAHWDGDGAARLLERADTDSALLVERLEPGEQLWTVQDEDEANRIAADVLRRLRRPTAGSHPFRTLAGEATRWAVELPERWRHLGRPFGRALLDEAVSACLDLTVGPVDEVVLHQDVHGGNVLRDGDGWRAIDPKPLIGDPAFDVASLLRDRRWTLYEPDVARRFRRRLDLLANELDLERERLRGWSVAHALAWGLDHATFDPELVECARLLSTAR